MSDIQIHIINCASVYCFI